MSDPAIYYLIGHGAVTVLILGQVWSINKRLGAGDSILDLLKKVCPALGGDGRCKDHERKNIIYPERP